VGEAAHSLTSAGRRRTIECLRPALQIAGRFIAAGSVCLALAGIIKNHTIDALPWRAHARIRPPLSLSPAGLFDFYAFISANYEIRMLTGRLLPCRAPRRRLGLLIMKQILWSHSCPRKRVGICLEP
jgi:hypothetical protein